MDEVPEVVQGALYAVHSASLCFQNDLKKLDYGDVKGPKAYRAAMLGEKKEKTILQMGLEQCFLQPAEPDHIKRTTGRVP